MRRRCPLLCVSAGPPKTPRHALMASLVPEFAPSDALKACLALKAAGETLPADSSVPFGDKGERVPVVAFVRRCVCVSHLSPALHHHRFVDCIVLPDVLVPSTGWHSLAAMADRDHLDGDSAVGQRRA